MSTNSELENNNAPQVQLESATRDKRRIKELEDEIQQLRSGRDSRRSGASTTVNKGRAYRRVVSLCDNPSDLVREYDRRASLADEGLDDEYDSIGPFPHSPSQQRTYRGFQELIEFMPWIKAKLTKCDPDELEELFKEGADGARGDDASTMKHAVVTWLPSYYCPIDPPLSPSLKSDRGLEHDATGSLLCPIEYNWSDLEVREKIRERHPDFLVTADSWPAFMYDGGHVYDPDNIEAGLFRSTILLKAFKLIFTSPTSAEDASVDDHPQSHEAASKRRCLSPGKATTRSHLRFALSSLSSWRMMDGDFNAHVFYDNIIDYFEDAPGPVAAAKVQTLLLWWDSRKVFGWNREIARAPEQLASLTVARLAAQRASAEQA
ncbi:hypothetical protein BU15DRAFT_46015 [Melanogaster broomeanus]|nr:hypothetical protein BU15DRAFT_46015 [Melanogaster broomeanus]